MREDDMPTRSDLFNIPVSREVQAKACWELALTLLIGSGMPERQARPYFGKLLARNRLHPADFLGTVRAAESAGTLDAASYLAKAAQRRSQARQDPSLACEWG